MESFPPSYAQTTPTNPWPLIAAYLPTETLLTVLQTSRQMHRNLSPFLWGDPASHSPVSAREGFRNPRSTAFRFIVSLSRTRYAMRELVHTIRIGRSAEETSVSGSSTWLRLLVKALPNLQSLDLSGSRNADHLSLSELKDLVEEGQGSVSRNGGASSIKDGLAGPPGLQVKLLSLNGCPNVTPSSLAAALSNLTSLAYLDLGNTSSAHHANAIASLARLPDLRVLGMSNTGLDDDAILHLGESTTHRLLSLDLSNNPKLTNDVFVRLQMTGHPPIGAASFRSSVDIDATTLQQAISSLAKITDIRAEAYKALTSMPRAHLLIESLPVLGIAQLDISTTNVSVDAAYTLLRTSGWMSFTCSDISPDSFTEAISTDARNKGSTADVQHASSARHLRVPASVANLLANELAHFPRLRTLTLTDAPTYSPTSHLNDALVNLISSIAERAYFAREGLAPVSDELQGITIEVNRPGYSARRARSLKGLVGYSTLTARGRESGGTREGRDPGWRSSTVSSITGDRDSENVARNAEGDFSFFDGRAEEEEGLYASTPTAQRPSQMKSLTSTSASMSSRLTRQSTAETTRSSVRSSTYSGLEDWTDVATAVPPALERKSPFVDLAEADGTGHGASNKADVVKELRQWRIGIRQEVEGVGRWIPGFWPGKVTIVRIGES